MNKRQPRPMLRAKGNLSYLEFIQLVKRFWELGHPDVPIVPAGTGNMARYPSIVYGLEVRRVHDSEPKPRYRETLDDNGTAVLISAQRFVNVISFSAVSQTESGGPEEAEAVIEAFENFMQEMVPVFKEAGVSEFQYARRLNDQEQNRAGAGTVTRTVAYTVTLEKLARIGRQQLQQIMDSIDQIVLDIRTKKTVQSERPMFITTTGENFIEVRGITFTIGDTVYLTEHEDIGYSFPLTMKPGYYMIMPADVTDPARPNLYALAKFVDNEDGYELFDITNLDGAGRIFYVRDPQVNVRIVDTHDGDDQEIG